MVVVGGFWGVVLRRGEGPLGGGVLLCPIRGETMSTVIGGGDDVQGMLASMGRGCGFSCLRGGCGDFEAGGCGVGQD